MKIFVFTLFFSLVMFFGCELRQNRLEQLATKRLPVVQPNSIFFDTLDATFWIGNTFGQIFQLDSAMNILNQINTKVGKITAIYTDKFNIIALTKLDVLIFDKNSKNLQKKVSLSKYFNKKTELVGLVFFPINRSFVIVPNQKKVSFYEFEPVNFRLIRKYTMKDLKNPSGATLYGENLLIAESNRLVVLGTKDKFKVARTFHHNVFDCKGVAYSPSLGIILLSKELRRIFIFKESQR